MFDDGTRTQAQLAAGGAQLEDVNSQLEGGRSQLDDVQPQLDDVQAGQSDVTQSCSGNVRKCVITTGTVGGDTQHVKNGNNDLKDKFKNEEQQLCIPRHVSLPYPPPDMEWVI